MDYAWRGKKLELDCAGGCGEGVRVEGPGGDNEGKESRQGLDTVKAASSSRTEVQAKILRKEKERKGEEERGGGT